MRAAELKINDLEAVVARMNGRPYHQVLSEFGTSPSRFLFSVTKGIDDLVKLAIAKGFNYFQISREIHGFNDENITRILEMDYDFLRERYRMIQEGMAKKFSEGTFMHRSIVSDSKVSHERNIENVVYIALTYHHPALASSDREEVIKELNKMISEHRLAFNSDSTEILWKYFSSISLGSVMNLQSTANSPLQILGCFDRKFQEVTGNSSLFDLSQPVHLHEWELFPRGYFKLQANRDRVAYHIFTEHTNPEMRRLLGSSQRADVLKGIGMMLPSVATFNNLGLISLTSNSNRYGEGGATKYVLESFDREYRRIHKRKSLMENLVFNSRNEFVGVDYNGVSTGKLNLNMDINDLSAVVARMNGMPYNQVLSNFSTNPRRFFFSVTKGLEDLANLATEDVARKILGFNDEAVTKMVEMDEEFLRQTYQRVQERKAGFLSYTFSHRSAITGLVVPHERNIENVVYIALTYHHPALASSDREIVINELTRIALADRDKPISVYFSSNLRLGTVMNVTDVHSSPLMVLRCFDRKFQEITGNASLFDLSQPVHLHEWGEIFKASHKYYELQANRDGVVYHAFTAHTDPGLRILLGSGQRENVLRGIELMVPSNKPFRKIGLDGVIGYYFSITQGEYQRSVLKSFDREYMRIHGGKSLMGNLVFDNRNRFVRVKY